MKEAFVLTFEMLEVEYLNEKGKPTESQGWRARIPGGWIVGFTGSSNFFDSVAGG